MLILARYLEEAILIGEARVTILNIVRRKNGRFQVKLGIEAPSDIPILRAELPPLHLEKKQGAPMRQMESCNDFVPVLSDDTREEASS